MNYEVCRYCGVSHIGVCPRVKSIKYNPDGTVKEVELHAFGYEEKKVGFHQTKEGETLK